MRETPIGYDVIGDVHGHAEKLEILLRKLDYREIAGAWVHPERRAIFVGDFIDRGPQQVRTVQIVRRMVEAGSALAVMGNHELNAIAWHTPDPRQPGEYLRPHFSALWGAKNRKQHAAFLAEVEDQRGLHSDIIQWFLTLPLWIELPELRVVHACWHSPYMAWLSSRLRDGRYLSEELLLPATDEPEHEAEKDDPNPTMFKAVEVLTKGIEVPLPDGYSFLDKDGIARQRVRLRWWDRAATTYRSAAMLSPAERDVLPEQAIPLHTRIDYSPKPVFFGHYWLTGAPATQSEIAACLDYSAGNGGPLVAYRFSGEERLTTEHLVWAG